ncbi:hypothetical protein [Priestia aryabhattai]
MYSDNIEIQRYQEKIYKQQHIEKVEDFFEQIRANRKRTDKKKDLNLEESTYSSFSEPQHSFKNRKELIIPSTLTNIEIGELKMQATTNIVKLNSDNLLEKLSLLRG